MFCQSKPREKIVPKWHEKPYEWNQVSGTQAASEKRPRGGGDRPRADPTFRARAD